jgi:hypothetical protein
MSGVDGSGAIHGDGNRILKPGLGGGPAASRQVGVRAGDRRQYLASCVDLEDHGAAGSAIYTLPVLSTATP